MACISATFFSIHNNNEKNERIFLFSYRIKSISDLSYSHTHRLYCHCCQTHHINNEILLSSLPIDNPFTENDFCATQKVIYIQQLASAVFGEKKNYFWGLFTEMLCTYNSFFLSFFFLKNGNFNKFRLCWIQSNHLMVSWFCIQINFAVFHFNQRRKLPCNRSISQLMRNVYMKTISIFAARLRTAYTEFMTSHYA